MHNGHFEVWEVELAAAGRGDRDGKGAIRADLARRLQQTTPLDPAWVRQMELESRRRRAHRDQTEQLIRESRAADASANRWLDAKETLTGQLLAAKRRGRW